MAAASVKRVAQIGLIVSAVLFIIALGIWLNFPTAFVLLAQAVGEQRNPVAFDLQFVDAPASRPAQVEVWYEPRTPIFGITEHYWSIIAPLHVDNITWHESVLPKDGHVRFTAQLGLVGLSGYRLQSIGVRPFGDADEAIHLELGSTEGDAEPTRQPIPLARVDNGTYTFDGALTLWRLTGAGEETAGFAYSPRASDPTRQIIWPGLRAVRARIDLATYPVTALAAPVAWEGYGWHRDGINLSRAGATLSDRRLETKRAARFAIPFSGDCAARPRFAVVTLANVPAWSRIEGLWRPVASETWERLMRSSTRGALDTHIARSPRSLDDVAPLEINAIAQGSYRLFATCGNPHYRSVAVTWLDAVVR
jgi:hypothetical protein